MFKVVEYDRGYTQMTSFQEPSHIHSLMFGVFEMFNLHCSGNSWKNQLLNDIQRPSTMQEALRSCA